MQSGYSPVASSGHSHWGWYLPMAQYGHSFGLTAAVEEEEGRRGDEDMGRMAAEEADEDAARAAAAVEGAGEEEGEAEEEWENWGMGQLAIRSPTPCAGRVVAHMRATAALLLSDASVTHRSEYSTR